MEDWRPDEFAPGEIWVRWGCDGVPVWSRSFLTLTVSLGALGVFEPLHSAHGYGMVAVMRGHEHRIFFNGAPPHLLSASLTWETAIIHRRCFRRRFHCCMICILWVMWGWVSLAVVPPRTRSVENNDYSLRAGGGIKRHENSGD